MEENMEEHLYDWLAERMNEAVVIQHESRTRKGVGLAQQSWPRPASRPCQRYTDQSLISTLAQQSLRRTRLTTTTNTLKP